MAAPMKFVPKNISITIFTIFIILLYPRSIVGSKKDFFSYEVDDIKGKRISLERYRGKVALVVNVASECGYTDGHYQALVHIQDDPALSDLFTVLAFPCNQFGNQEPKPNNWIYEFAKKNYRVNFPMFSKIDVIGDSAHPVYGFLTEKTSQEPNWNFWKYLVNPGGEVIRSWGPWISVEETYTEILAAVRKARGKRHGGDL
ncbi:glutathione peroxidase 7-like [Glandiceps talaboti]